MTDYTTITTGEIDQDSPVTQPLLTALRDNPIAITEGSTGAPKIQTAAYAAGSINRAALKTAVNTVSGSLDASGGFFPNAVITLDAYSFFPSINAPATTAVRVTASSTSGTADAPKIGLSNTGVSSANYDVDWRYIQA